MRKVLLMIVVLALGAFAFAQPADSDNDFTQPSAGGSYDEILAAQVLQSQNLLAAIVVSSPANAIPDSFDESQPGSMASNEQSSDEDTYSQTISTQSLEHSLNKAAASQF